VTKLISILASGLALLCAGPALASGPAASVSADTSTFSASGTTTIRFEDDGADPASSLDLYAPHGYTVDLSQPLGATIGRMDATATLADGSTVHLAGVVKSADPATHVGDSATCTPDRALHDAVWTIGLNANGTAYGPLLLFADRGTGTGLFSARLRACLRDPATAGFRLTRATLAVTGVFTNPATAGDYRWTAILRTFASPSIPFESQTIVQLPPRLTLTHKVLRPRGPYGRRFIHLSGRVTENGHGVAGVRVEVLYGPRVSSMSRLTYATSFDSGKYAVVAPIARKTVFRAKISAPLRVGPISRCETFSLEPAAICSSLTLAPFSAQTAAFTVDRVRA
jgi:hypothetical protein